MLNDMIFLSCNIELATSVNKTADKTRHQLQITPNIMFVFSRNLRVHQYPNFN